MADFDIITTTELALPAAPTIPLNVLEDPNTIETSTIDFGEIETTSIIQQNLASTSCSETMEEPTPFWTTLAIAATETPIFALSENVVPELDLASVSDTNIVDQEEHSSKPLDAKSSLTQTVRRRALAWVETIFSRSSKPKHQNTKRAVTKMGQSQSELSDSAIILPAGQVANGNPAEQKQGGSKAQAAVALAEAAKNKEVNRIAEFTRKTIPHLEPIVKVSPSQNVLEASTQRHPGPATPKFVGKRESATIPQPETDSYAQQEKSRFAFPNRDIKSESNHQFSDSLSPAGRNIVPDLPNTKASVPKLAAAQKAATKPTTSCCLQTNAKDAALWKTSQHGYGKRDKRVARNKRTLRRTLNLEWSDGICLQLLEQETENERGIFHAARIKLICKKIWEFNVDTEAYIWLNIK